MVDSIKKVNWILDKKIVLRPFSYDDKEMLFEWRNTPFLIKNSTSGRMVSWDEHCQWFDEIYHQELTKVFIIQYGQQPIGQIRFEYIRNNQYQITIYLLEKYTGQGLGYISLKKGMDIMTKDVGDVEFMALVKKGNQPSYSLFRQVGFKETDDSENIPPNHSMFRYAHDEHGIVNNDKMTPLIDFYDKQVKQYGNSVHAVAWGSTTSQEMRFDILSQVGDLNGKNILDVGCGLGDFYSWLHRNGIKANYEGIDITASMIQQATKKYPQAKFKTLNILELNELTHTYDYVFASGIFNRKIKDHKHFVHEMIKGMFGLCYRAIAFNIMSINADFMKEDEYYADPDALFKFCCTLSQNVVINHDYMPHDFTVFMYKDNGYEQV